MAVTWQIPRNCLAWLLLSQFAVLLPHSTRLPWWVLATTLFCALWRLLIYQGRCSLPPKYLKVVLAVLCVIGIYRSYGTFIGLEPTVALLFFGFSVKLLEVSSRRDVYFLLFLAYFVAATGFLFTQALWLVAYTLITLLIISSSLVALHQHDLTQLNMQSMRCAATIFLQALPLMIVLFLVFPRFDPLWSVPGANNQGKTGMSEDMSPGDVSRLGQSDELVFRAIFEGRPPQRHQLYWRGLVLSNFDGRTWHQSRTYTHLLTRPRDQRAPEGVRYTIIQEPTSQRWTFTLPTARTSEPGLKEVSDFRIISLQRIQTRQQFDVESVLNARRDPNLGPREQRFNTQLPPGSGERSRQLAHRLRLESASDEQYIERVLDYFSQQPFYYTLDPPLLGDDPVDEFLFQTRKGFCEHYASSFVVLMRAVGIPARVIGGYQGGDFNPATGVVTIRQYDAHAWAEVWLHDRGWMRVDPTEAVSPLRIQAGLERALTENREQFLANSPLSPHRYRHVQWINTLRLRLEALDYQWTAWVLGYRGQRQFDLLSTLLGGVSAVKVVALVLAVGGLLFAIVGWRLFRGRRQAQPQQKLYAALCRALARRGLERAPSESPTMFERRVVEREPGLASAVGEVTRSYTALSFEKLSPQRRRELLRQMRRQVLALRLRLRMT